MNRNLSIGDYVKISGHGDRKVRVLSLPRRIPGGDVVRVTWATSEDAPREAYSAYGTLHPAHAPGFEWEVPVLNLR